MLRTVGKIHGGTDERIDRQTDRQTVMTKIIVAFAVLGTRLKNSTYSAAHSVVVLLFNRIQALQKCTFKTLFSDNWCSVFLILFLTVI